MDKEKKKTYSDEEVRGDRAKKAALVNKKDGWKKK